MELRLLIERLQAHQIHNPDKPQMQLQHLTNRLHPVHRISQPRPGQQAHLVLPVDVVWGLEDDKYFIVSILFGKNNFFFQIFKASGVAMINFMKFFSESLKLQ